MAGAVPATLGVAPRRSRAAPRRDARRPRLNEGARHARQLEQVGGRWQLRFTRKLPHPPEKVWRALTQPDHLAAWFPTTIEGERSAGAPLRFAFPGDEAPPFEGELITYDPPSVLEFRWGDDDVLGHHLAGEEPSWDASERWPQVHPSYVERFGPDASTIGPPESATEKQRPG